MARYRLLGGTHMHGIKTKAKHFKKGDIIETDDDLCAMFANKFEKLPDLVEAPKAKKKADEDEKPTKGDSIPDGENVTKEFPDAEGLTMQVFMVGEDKKARYNVYDGDDLSAPLNKKPLKKTQVSSFIASMNSDDDELETPPE